MQAERRRSTRIGARFLVEWDAGDFFAPAEASDISPHGLAVDSRGDIYVGEVSYTNWKTSFPDKPMPSSIRSLQKLEKVS